MKICSKCKNELSLRYFHKDPKNKDRLCNRCSFCISNDRNNEITRLKDRLRKQYKKLSMNYKWQGKTIKAVFGYCKVKLNKEKPLFWYNYECSVGLNKVNNTALIEAIQINDGNYIFCISNHFGIGVYKLLKGGWPDVPHFSLEDCAFTKSNHAARAFDADAYAEHEANREKWRLENFPEEYEKIKSLRNLANGIKSGILSRYKALN